MNKTKIILIYILSLFCSIGFSQWKLVSTYPGRYIGSIASNDSIVYVGDANGLFISHNNGTTWASINGLPKSMSLVQLNDTNAFDIVGGYGYGIYVSGNNGNSWKIPDSNSFARDTLTTCTVANGNTLFVGTSNGLYYSNNLGESWALCQIGNAPYGSVESLAVGDSVVYVSGSLSGGYYIYASYDDGLTWQPIVPIHYFSAIAMTVIDTNIFVASDPYEGVYYSHNNGKSWDTVNNGLPRSNFGNIYINTLIHIGTKLIAGTDSGVYISSNYGKNWNAYNNGFIKPDLQIEALGYNNTTLFAGGDSLYAISLSDVLSINEVAATSGTAKIYPNPSNGCFTISIQSITNKAQVEVYNMLGQSIYRSNLNPINTYINLSGQPAGVYLYRIVSEYGEYIANGKLIIN